MPASIVRRPFVVGDTYRYYGSLDSHFFRLDDTVFEAVEERDGIESRLLDIKYSSRPLYDFLQYPLAIVKLCREGALPIHGFFEQPPEAYSFNGYSLVDASDHVWLYVGTDAYNAEERPCFVFQDRPSPLIEQILRLQDRTAVDTALAAYGRELERLR